MSLIFWLLPPTPLPEKPNDLLRTSCLSPEPPCTGTPAHTQGAGGRGRQPLGSAAPACGSRGVFKALQQSFVSQPSDIQSLKEFSLPVGPPSGAGPSKTGWREILKNLEISTKKKVCCLPKWGSIWTPPGHQKIRKIHKSASQEVTFHPFPKTSRKVMIPGPSSTL